jgi:radical SAM-linked protein
MPLERRQRLRITFAKGEPIKYISHLDLMRTWERALRRAQVPLAYSEGFNPRPKISIASALPVGLTGRGEVMDIVLSRHISPYNLIKRLKPHLPPGLEVLSVEEVYFRLPSLQSQMRYAEYRVVVESEETLAEMEKRVEQILSAQSLPRQRERKGRVTEYDLRPLIDDLWIEGLDSAGSPDQSSVRSPDQSSARSPDHRREGTACVLGMRLQSDSQATGRPDEVLEAMGLGELPHSIERTRCVFGNMEK